VTGIGFEVREGRHEKMPDHDRRVAIALLTRWFEHGGTSSCNMTPVVERGRHDHNQHVAAILILTVLIQVILVKSWT
jgi:hypothetical protein